MNEDLAVTSRNFRVDRLRTCIAALEMMTAKTQQTLSDLEPFAGHDQGHVRPERASILQMYVSRLDQSIETRCQNLRSTLQAIERERLRAQNELSVALQVEQT